MSPGQPFTAQSLWRANLMRLSMLYGRCMWCLATVTLLPTLTMASQPVLATVGSLVLSYICDVLGWEPRMLAAKELLSLSLTCRSWAAALRPIVLERVTVSSEAEALELLQLLDSSAKSGTRLGEYIKLLSMRDNVSSADGHVPWFHIIWRARSKLYARNPFLLSINLPVKKSPYSLLAAIPESLPDAAAQCNHVFLSKCRIPSFDDLLVFCGKTGGYGYLNCSMISWGDESEVEDGARPPSLAVSSRATSSEISLGRVDNRWPFIWLFLTTTRHLEGSEWTANRVRYIDPAELPKLESLARCVLQTRDRRCLTHALELYGKRAAARLLNAMLTAVFSDENGGATSKLRMRCESPWSTPNVHISITSTTGLVTAVDVIFDHLQWHGDETSLLIVDTEPFHYHWAALDECLHAFGGTLQTVSVRVRTDEEHMKTFAELIAPNMSHVVGAGKLELYYAQPIDGYRWEDDMIRDFWKFTWRKLN